MSNTKLFNKIAKRGSTELVINLNEDFTTSLGVFRNATSKIRTLNGIDYPCVYLGENDYGGLTINYAENKNLKLIVNLEFYYVYGFLLDDGKVYAFSGEADEALTKFGFETETISYGDGYYDICKLLSNEEYYTLKQTTVELPQIINALNQINDISISFDEKAKSILIAFWSLVEGIRFQGISNVVNTLIENKPSDFIYDYFYELAEIWAKLCVIAAYEKRQNDDIAVYDLHRIH